MKRCWHCSREITGPCVTWQARRFGTEKWFDLCLHPGDCVKWFSVDKKISS